MLLTSDCKVGFLSWLTNWLEDWTEGKGKSVPVPSHPRLSTSLLPCACLSGALPPLGFFLCPHHLGLAGARPQITSLSWGATNQSSVRPWDLLHGLAAHTPPLCMSQN